METRMRWWTPAKCREQSELVSPCKQRAVINPASTEWLAVSVATSCKKKQLIASSSSSSSIGDVRGFVRAMTWVMSVGWGWSKLDVEWLRFIQHSADDTMSPLNQQFVCAVNPFRDHNYTLTPAANYQLSIGFKEAQRIRISESKIAKNNAHKWLKFVL